MPITGIYPVVNRLYVIRDDYSKCDDDHSKKNHLLNQHSIINGEVLNTDYILVLALNTEETLHTPCWENYTKEDMQTLTSVSKRRFKWQTYPPPPPESEQECHRVAFEDLRSDTSMSPTFKTSFRSRKVLLPIKPCHQVMPQRKSLARTMDHLGNKSAQRRISKSNLQLRNLRDSRSSQFRTAIFKTRREIKNHWRDL